MEIKLNRAYSSGWDNIEHPIYQLSDESYHEVLSEMPRKLESEYEWIDVKGGEV